MNDLRAALMEATFNALNVTDVTTLATVVQHTLENTQPPLVIVREVSEMIPEGGKDGGLYRARILVSAHYRGTKGTEAAAIMDAVASTLETTVLTATGLVPVLPHSVESSGMAQGEDGVTYDGEIIAEAFAQPA